MLERFDGGDRRVLLQGLAGFNNAAPAFQEARHG
jgi:hypothetical protein